jgi:lipoprotein-anchoring transpeptidase ErfK/SrfK
LHAPAGGGTICGTVPAARRAKPNGFARRRRQRLLALGAVVGLLAAGGAVMTAQRGDSGPAGGRVRGPAADDGEGIVPLDAGERSAGAAARRPLPPLRRPAVVVRKAAGRLTVYDGARPVKTYPVVTGAEPGDKRREGDRRTPEGLFYICVKNPRSRFTRSLGLSYPTAEDAERGLREGLIDRATYRAIVRAVRARRRPPWKTALGGEIMIHGGGTDRSGTLGCVGMADADIRELYRALPVGTPVEIRP